jgi:hypothetical protein
VVDFARGAGLDDLDLDDPETVNRRGVDAEAW